MIGIDSSFYLSQIVFPLEVKLLRGSINLLVLAWILAIKLVPNSTGLHILLDVWELNLIKEEGYKDISNVVGPAEE